MKKLEQMKIDVGEKLRKAREAKEKRQVDVDLETTLTLKTVSLLENGKNNACLETLDLYVTYLGGQLILDVEFPDDENPEETKEGVER